MHPKFIINVVNFYFLMVIIITLYIHSESVSSLPLPKKKRVDLHGKKVKLSKSVGNFDCTKSCVRDKDKGLFVTFFGKTCQIAIEEQL